MAAPWIGWGRGILLGMDHVIAWMCWAYKGLRFSNDYFLALGAVCFLPPPPPLSSSFSFLSLKIAWAFPEVCQVHMLLGSLMVLGSSRSWEHSPIRSVSQLWPGGREVCTLPKPWEAATSWRHMLLNVQASLPSTLEEEAVRAQGPGAVLLWDHEYGPGHCLPLSNVPLAISQVEKK